MLLLLLLLVSLQKVTHPLVCKGFSSGATTMILRDLHALLGHLAACRTQCFRQYYCEGEVRADVNV